MSRKCIQTLVDRVLIGTAIATAFLIGEKVYKCVKYNLPRNPVAVVRTVEQDELGQRALKFYDENRKTSNYKKLILIRKP